MLPALALPAGLATLLLAAKAHGRELRLEREAAGYHEVVFGAQNPPFVEELWARDRRRFWGLALPIAGALLVAMVAWRPAGWGFVAALALPIGMIVGFAACGLASLARHPASGRGGSAAWWLGALGSAAAMMAGLALG